LLNQKGSVIGALLFVIYINDLPEITSHLCKLFADDSKLIATIRNTNDLMILQNDLDKLVDWSNTWKMKFNSKKCKIVKFESSRDYIMNGFDLTMTDSSGNNHKLEESKSERDLGVYVQSNLKWTEQVKHSCNKAYNMINTLKRTFKYWDKAIFLKLYCTYIRPHLEYCIQAWNPSFKKDIAELEKVQRRATKMVPCISNMPYDKRLAYLNLQTLDKRRQRGDLIQYFKIYKGFNKLNWYNMNRLMISNRQDGPSSGVRGNNHRLARQLTKLECRKNFISNRVVTNWNKLPESIIDSSTIVQFKKRYDVFL
jgi:hypothetical protein